MCKTFLNIGSLQNPQILSQTYPWTGFFIKKPVKLHTQGSLTDEWINFLLVYETDLY